MNFLFKLKNVDFAITWIRDVNHSRLCNAEVTSTWSCTSAPPRYLRGVDRENSVVYIYMRPSLQLSVLFSTWNIPAVGYLGLFCGSLLRQRIWNGSCNWSRGGLVCFKNIDDQMSVSPLVIAGCLGTWHRYLLPGCLWSSEIKRRRHKLVQPFTKKSARAIEFTSPCLSRRIA